MRPQILIAGSDVVFLQSLKSILNDYDKTWDIHNSASAVDALEKIANTNLDTIVLDCQMPGSYAPTLYDEIGTNERMQNVPILAVTERSEGAIRRLLSDPRVADVLIKSVDPFDAIARVRSALRLKCHVEERNRLARDIHDTLAQGLTGIVIQLQVATRSNRATPAAWRAPVEQARTLAEECLADVRRSVQALRSFALEREGLAGALMRMLRNMTYNLPIKSNFRIEGKVSALAFDIEHNVLRVCQEAVTNALRHSGAKEVNVNLTYEPHQLSLLVHDNGHGFDTLLSRDGCFGLAIMRERAARINGSVSVISQPELGSTVYLIIPRDFPDDQKTVCDITTGSTDANHE
jgi:signal transduction histidine kinase